MGSLVGHIRSASLAPKMDALYFAVALIACLLTYAYNGSYAVFNDTVRYLPNLPLSSFNSSLPRTLNVPLYSMFYEFGAMLTGCLFLSYGAARLTGVCSRSTGAKTIDSAALLLLSLLISFSLLYGLQIGTEAFSIGAFCLIFAVVLGRGLVALDAIVLILAMACHTSNWLSVAIILLTAVVFLPTYLRYRQILLVILCCSLSFALESFVSEHQNPGGRAFSANRLLVGSNVLNLSPL